MAKNDDAMKVSGWVVSCNCAVRREASAPEHVLAVSLDFEGCSQEQLLIWATRSRKIDLQRALRGCSEDMLRAMEGSVLKRKAVEAGNGFESPDKAFNTAKNAGQRLSREQRAALIAQLQAMDD